MISWRTDIENAPKSALEMVSTNNPKSKTGVVCKLVKRRVLIFSEGVGVSLTYWLPHNYDGRGGGDRWNGMSKGEEPSHWSELNMPDGPALTQEQDT